MENPITGTLFDSLDQNKRLKPSAYYSICFGTLPSNVRLALTLDRTKETVDTLLEQMELGTFEFTTVFKNWVTEDFQNAKPDDDYVFEYLFKSELQRMVIHFVARDTYTMVDFYFDQEDPKTEAWVLEINHKLRSKFGTPKQPKFKVLMHQDGMFGTEDVNTSDFKSIEIAELYNDDFIEVDKVISGFMGKKESGIVLLHGEPGTGKTTYIKHLLCKFTDREFIFIQNDFVSDLLKPTFISFLLQNKNAVLVIEDAEKVVVPRDHHSESSVVSTILQLTDGLFSDFLNIKIICTFNTDIERIDKALLRKGRMVAKYSFGALSPEKTKILAQKLGHANVEGSLTLAEIFGYDKLDFKEKSKRKIGFV
ncbi:MAG: AAA family ATPase [Anaerolineales bacterium]|nr:AAA family ATPase [Anaerolineales bacterium]